MLRRIALLILFLIGTTAITPLAQAQQTGFILFYRPDASLDPGSNPTVYFIKGTTDTLATIAKGEFFALELAEGVYTFSWTRAPSRTEKVTVNLHRGEQVFVRTRYADFKETAAVEAPQDLRGVGPIDRLRVFDPDVLIPQQRIEFAERREATADATPAQQEVQPVVQTANVEADNRAGQDPRMEQVPTAAFPQQAPPSGKSKKLKIHGYVTAVNAGSFEIEDYRITRDRTFVLGF